MNLSTLFSNKAFLTFSQGSEKEKHVCSPPGGGGGESHIETAGCEGCERPDFVHV